MIVVDEYIESAKSVAAKNLKSLILHDVFGFGCREEGWNALFIRQQAAEVMTDPLYLTNFQTIEMVNAVVAKKLCNCITCPTEVKVSMGLLTLTGYDPTVASMVYMQPDLGVLTLTGYDPEVTASTNVDVDFGVLTLTGYDPTINIVPAPQYIYFNEPDALTLTGFDPTVLASTYMEVDFGVMTLSGFTVTISVV